MGSDVAAEIVRRAAVPFLAGAAATAALLGGLYATATVALLVALWAAALIGRAAGQEGSPSPASPIATPMKADEERRLRLYLDLSPAPLVALGPDDRLQAVNRAARRLFAVDDLIRAPPPLLLETIGATSPGESTTVPIDPGDGERTLAIVTADLDGHGGRIRVAALTDIGADLRAKEAATLQELVTVLGHEVTNTLTPIASLSATAAEILADPAPDLLAVRAAIETVSRRALALQRFGEAYRDLARLPPPTLRAFDLVETMTDLAKLFRTRWPAVALDLAAPASLRVNGDADQIAQGVWALLQNAAEVGTRVRVEIMRRGAGATITVGDNGPGIEIEDSEAVFRPFFTTKETGSGVGLALTRQIFRGHDGDLRLVRAKPSAVFEAAL